LCAEFVEQHGCLAIYMAQAAERNMGRHTTVFHRATNKHRCKGAAAEPADDDDTDDDMDDVESDDEEAGAALPRCPSSGCSAMHPCGIRQVLHRDLRLLLARLLLSTDQRRRSRHDDEPPRKRQGVEPKVQVNVFY